MGLLSVFAFKINLRWYNKVVRKREQEAAEEANRLKKRQRHDLSNLKHLNAALTEAEVEGADGRERRDVARAERTLEAPSRLGKHLYEAGAYTRPLFSSTWAVYDTKYILNTPF